MCKIFFQKLCNDYKEIDDYDDKIPKEETWYFTKCIKILNKEEPNLIISYNITNNTIIFSREWNEWIKKISFSFKQFISEFNQINIDFSYMRNPNEVREDNIIQEIYFCKIPLKYHKMLVAFLEVEYLTRSG